MINLVRRVEECPPPTVSVRELIRSGPEVVVGDRRIDVRGQAGNGREAIELMAELVPDVALIKIRISVMAGSAATRKLTRRRAPGRVPILTTYDCGTLRVETLEAGAGGY